MTQTHIQYYETIPRTTIYSNDVEDNNISYESHTEKNIQCKMQKFCIYKGKMSQNRFYFFKKKKKIHSFHLNETMFPSNFEFIHFDMEPMELGGKPEYINLFFVYL